MRLPGLPALWAGVLLAPLAFFLQFQVNFTLSQWACSGGPMWAVYAALAAGLVVAAAGAWIGWRNWRTVGGEWPGDSAGAVERTRFMGLGGMILSSAFCLIILAQSLTTAVLGVCQ
jgi:hypothetical protein